MTLQQLKYVVTVAENGTITNTAKKLYISQPSLTNAIHELEKEMNITIFNSKYTAESLEAGEEYLFYGKVGGNFHRREMNSPLVEKVTTGMRIHPIYHLTAGINSKYIEKLIRHTARLVKRSGGNARHPAPVRILPRIKSKEIADGENSELTQQLGTLFTDALQILYVRGSVHH